MIASRDWEAARKSLHIAMGGFALALRYLSWWQAAVLAGMALAFNRFLLPRVGGHSLYRRHEVARGHAAGILLYPLSILALIFLFPARLDIVAAAWGIMAFGDGFATVTGLAIGGPQLPWNREKTFAGTSALILCGGAAGAFLAWWCRPAVMPPPYLWYSLAVPFVAALAAAAVESMPIRLDDNVSVPATAAAVLWAGSLMNEQMLHDLAVHAVWTSPAAIAVNGLVAFMGHRARTVSTSGAVAGALIGTVIVVSAGWGAWGLLMATFIAASVTSRIGLKRKSLLGIAEERGGRRGAGNAIANTGVAAAAAILAATTYTTGSALIGFVAALSAAGSDTVASEIGKAFGRHTYRVPTFAPVPPGTSGAISLEGTAAGLMAALALATIGLGLHLVDHEAILPIVAGATVGSFSESVMGSTLEPAGLLNNDALNFLNAAIAASVAVLLAGAIS